MENLLDLEHHIAFTPNRDNLIHCCKGIQQWDDKMSCHAENSGTVVQALFLILIVPSWAYFGKAWMEISRDMTPGCMLSNIFISDMDEGVK